MSSSSRFRAHIIVSCSRCPQGAALTQRQVIFLVVVTEEFLDYSAIDRGPYVREWLGHNLPDPRVMFLYHGGSPSAGKIAICHWTGLLNPAPW